MWSANPFRGREWGTVGTVVNESCNSEVEEKRRRKTNGPTARICNGWGREGVAVSHALGRSGLSSRCVAWGASVLAWVVLLVKRWVEIFQLSHTARLSFRCRSRLFDWPRVLLFLFLVLRNRSRPIFMNSSCSCSLANVGEVHDRSARLFVNGSHR